MKQLVLFIAMFALGMNAVAQGGYTNPCNGSTVSYTDASMSCCVTDMEHTFARWSTLNPGVKKPGSKTFAGRELFGWR